MSKGLSGGMFDFNKDGKMEAFERAAECQFLDEVVFSDDSSFDGNSDSETSPLSTSSSFTRNVSTSKTKKPEVTGISIGGKTIYNATKDSHGVTIFKSLLVIGLCIAGIAIPVCADMEGIAVALFPLGAVVLSALILNNT